MVRKQEEHVLAAMKGAKTAKEMTESWLVQRPGYEPPPNGYLKLWFERKPEMIPTFSHNALTQMVERGILDPKTRYLMIIACYMTNGHWLGIPVQCANAKAAGATEEEIMEVAHIACYAASKAKLSDVEAVLSKVFDSDSFKNTQPLGQ